jgi:hypothetical protein
VSELTHRIYKLAEARSYDADFHAWADAQASPLRRQRPAGLDWRNLIEELEGIARSDERALESHLAILLMHLWFVHLLLLVHLRNQYKDRWRDYSSDAIATMMTLRAKDLRN